MRAVRPNRPPNEMEEKPFLVGSKVSAVLNLHSRLELCEVQKVPAIDGEVFDLLRGQHPLHRCLLRVDGNLSALHLDDLGGLTDLQFDVP